MNISLNWLKDYIDIPSSPEELGSILTSLGLEVEGMKEVLSIPGGLEGLVIGEVKTNGKHPNADRLSVNTVDIGEPELLHIVCGAPNVAAGQKVIVAPVNTILHPTEGEPFKIKKGKIRGKVSEGMICSEDEIGLGHNHDGIVVLDELAKVGGSVADYYELDNDIVYEIGLTPNRSDATSHIGVARDLLAYYKYHSDSGLQLKTPQAQYTAVIDESKKVKVEVRDLDRCPRFSGITLSNVKVGPSPEWIQKRLNAIGVRPISNIVDITNYVLHEYGQPLHAYDLSKISDQKIHVQTLATGTEFQSLDEKVRKLDNEDLVVCDGDDKGMCIAGVFGGMNSGVTDETKDIFLEAAHFDAHSIRKTSTRHLLRTDAAKCFEKGADPAMTVKALKRAAYLMTQYAGSEVSSEVVDVYPEEISPKEIVVRKDRVNALIGASLSADDIERILNALDIKIVSKTDHSFTTAIPTNKADVVREVDVIEEILRIYGFDNVEVPVRLNTPITSTTKIDIVKLRKIISELLVNKGFNEMKGLSLIPSLLYEGTKLAEKIVKINNTSNIHLDVMRPEMLYSTLLAAQHNINRQQKDLSLFENGRSYTSKENGFEETEWITLFKTGRAYSGDWRPEARDIDFYDVKKAVLSIFERLGVHSLKIEELENEAFEYGLHFHRGPMTIANVGLVSRAARGRINLDEDIFYAELHVANLLRVIQKNTVTIEEIPKYPSTSRDLALTIDENVNYQQIEGVIKKNAGSLLKEIALFDIYKDKKQLGEGKKSYAVSMTFESLEKNLKDKEIDKIVNKVIAQLDSEVGAKLR